MKVIRSKSQEQKWPTIAIPAM